MSHVTPEELDVSLRRVKKYIDDNAGGGSSGGSVTIDAVLDGTSENPVQNKVIKAALDDKADTSDIPDVSGLALKSEIPDVSGFALTEDIPDISGKQDALTFDTAPTENSANPVTSGGVYAALQNQTGYELPVATANILGGIKVGSGLAIDDDGVLYVIGSSGQPGFVTLSSESVSLDPDNQTSTINILTKSAPVSVRSTNDTLATASVAGDTIIITAGTGKGSCEIIVETQRTGIYSSVSKTINVVVSNIKIVTWANGTDAEIKAMLDAHYAGDLDIHDYWSVGDERANVQLPEIDNLGSGLISAQTKTLRLVSGGTRMLSDDTTPCAFVVGFVNNLSTAGYMNSSASNTGGWRDSERRAWCNTTLYNSLPEGIKVLIKESVSKSNIVNGSVMSIVDVDDYVFIPSLTEAYGENPQYNYYNGQGVKFENPGSVPGYYTIAGTSRSGGWSRTSVINSSNSFYRCGSVPGSGNAVTSISANTASNCYIQPFFCI